MVWTRGLSRLVTLISLVLLALLYLPASNTEAQGTRATTLYLPVMQDSYPWASPFGVEIDSGTLANSTIRQNAANLGAKWHRLNGAVSWREVQPTEGGPYDWSALARFERDILASRGAGMTPIVIVDDYPHWATLNIPYPTACGPLRAEYFDEYAAFLSALVERYHQPPYNVHYWELGNEVDVDPSLVVPDNMFGCWGDMQDIYYGGRHYGEMLKAVVPSIRQVDPQAKILIGGLLLHTYETTDPTYGRSEYFFEGILLSGAAPYFDIVAYHGYPSYADIQIDYDLHHYMWGLHRGGMAVGKAHFLQEVMARYGVSKPLFLDETGLLCTPPHIVCDPPSPDFFQAQADHVVRAFTRAIGNGVDQVTWFTLNGPGWRSGALLDQTQGKKPAYLAYQQLIKQTYGAALPPPRVDYGNPMVEGYRFNKRALLVDVLWTLDSTPSMIAVPQNQFIAAYGRDGEPVTTFVWDSLTVRVPVGFSPVYVHLRP